MQNDLDLLLLPDRLRALISATTVEPVMLELDPWEAAALGCERRLVLSLAEARALEAKARRASRGQSASSAGRRTPKWQAGHTPFPSSKGVCRPGARRHSARDRLVLVGGTGYEGGEGDQRVRRCHDRRDFQR